jgi:hypothetical protein
MTCELANEKKAKNSETEGNIDANILSKRKGKQ